VTLADTPVVAAIDAGPAGLIVYDERDPPLAPSGSAMCFAASVAAALLSAEAVVSGTPLSTPESLAITGMFAVFACCRSGAVAAGTSSDPSGGPMK
jgi:hypothetical protein